MFLQKLPSLPAWATGFRELDETRRDLERLFAVLHGQADVPPAGVFPPINVTEDTDALHVRAELPGVGIDDLEITIENGTVTLAGERKPVSTDEAPSYHRREREWGAFRRSFSLPTRVDSDKVQARYVDGILTVSLPKAAEARPKQIVVQAGTQS